MDSSKGVCFEFPSSQLQRVKDSRSVAIVCGQDPEDPLALEALREVRVELRLHLEVRVIHRLTYARQRVSADPRVVRLTAGRNLDLQLLQCDLCPLLTPL